MLKLNITVHTAVRKIHIDTDNDEWKDFHIVVEGSRHGYIRVLGFEDDERFDLEEWDQLVQAIDRARKQWTVAFGEVES